MVSFDERKVIAIKNLNEVKIINHEVIYGHTFIITKEMNCRGQWMEIGLYGSYNALIFNHPINVYFLDVYGTYFDRIELDNDIYRDALKYLKT